MIEVLFARLHQLTNRLRRIANHTTQYTYGDGLLGNWYIGLAQDDQEVDPSYDKFVTYDTESASNYQMPFFSAYNFNNLTIDEGAVVKFAGDTAILRVKDTLRLYGTIDLSNCHPGGQYATNCGTTWSENHMFGSTHVLPDTGFIVTGSTNCGGICVIYYNQLVNELNTTPSGLEFNTNNVLIGGGSGSGGGYLSILAKKVMLSDTGRIDVRAGDGSVAANAGKLLTYQLKEADL